ncbi:MAG: S-layer homology domain-containing protein, partial [Armatimonadota bacterium]|nr:S-layer homology domain-containing protein [Armatimonadota bacterium]
MTRKTAGAVVLALVLALVAPGFTQPFADVPTNHWAYDAIAELAAKGLIEGYPDGTFKGNQPLTRYEMAMVVARIIARIEAIPTPPPPEVRRADLDAVRRDLGAAVGRISVNERNIATLQRLVNEFRAELQALGVRVTALEEELQALRARLDNTRVTGLFDAWYQVNQLAGTNAIPIWPRIRLQFTGTVAPDVSVFMRARWFSNVNNAQVLDWDLAYLTVNNFLGWEGLTLRAGREQLALGPIGLLLNEPIYTDHRTGVSLAGALGPVRFLALSQYSTINQANATTVYGGRLSIDPIPGWTLGVNFRADPDPLNQLRRGSGWSVDLSARLAAGLTLRAEWATYTNQTTNLTGNYLYADA